MRNLELELKKKVLGADIAGLDKQKEKAAREIFRDQRTKRLLRPIHFGQIYDGLKTVRTEIDGGELPLVLLTAHAGVEAPARRRPVAIMFRRRYCRRAVSA